MPPVKTQFRSNIALRAALDYTLGDPEFASLDPTLPISATVQEVGRHAFEQLVDQITGQIQICAIQVADGVE
jgi:hypothetical protein